MISAISSILALACAGSAVPAPASPAHPFTLRTLARACEGKDGWSEPAPPAQLFGNTWYVGTCGITVLLVTSPQGHVLVDGGPGDVAPLVLANIRRLGFNLRDVRWIVSSHEHHDHVGALPDLVKATGARVAALGSASTALTTGRPSPDDPQRGLIADARPLRIDRVLQDGESITIPATGPGMPLVLTVHATPAHAPGSASWTWQSCTDAMDCRMIAYADSVSTPAADSYRFSDHPDRQTAFALGLERIADLPCDILLTPHPGASAMFDRFSGKAPLVAPTACRTYAAQARVTFATRLANEATGTTR